MIDFQWAVEFGLQNIRIAHVDEFGNVELLNTECNVDLETFQVVCKGVTDKGFPPGYQDAACRVLGQQSSGEPRGG